MQMRAGIVFFVPEFFCVNCRRGRAHTFNPSLVIPMWPPGTQAPWGASLSGGHKERQVGYPFYRRATWSTAALRFVCTWFLVSLKKATSMNFRDHLFVTSDRPESSAEGLLEVMPEMMEGEAGFPVANISGPYQPRPGYEECEIRYNYRCIGDPFDRWLAQHGRELDEMEDRVQSTPMKKSVLFIGNSLIGEMAGTFLCMLGRRLAFVNRSIYESRGQHFRVSTTDAGGKVYSIYNNVWTFQGAVGMGRISRELGLDFSRLDLVVLGAWNTCNHQCQEMSGKDYGGPWTPHDFAKYLHSQNFRGHMLLSGPIMMGRPVAKASQVQDFGQFKVMDLEMYQRIFAWPCFAPGCTEVHNHELDNGHQCIPGPIHFLINETFNYLAADS